MAWESVPPRLELWGGEAPIEAILAATQRENPCTEQVLNHASPKLADFWTAPEHRQEGPRGSFLPQTLLCGSPASSRHPSWSLEKK